MNEQIMHTKRNSTIGFSLGLLLLMIFSSQSAVALGLGNIRVTSSLNEPLSASIEILKDSTERNITADDLTIGLADKALHENTGITFQNILKDLRFSVLTGSNGELTLNVYTVRNVYEPLLNFLIDLRWKGGRLVKEYSTILDPIDFNSQPAANSAPEPSAAPRPAVRQARNTRSTSRPVVLDGENYQVRSGDSLSKIAIAVRARDGGDLEQIMAQIYAANPEAFLGSPDQLMANVPLRIPSDINNIASNPLSVPLETPTATLPVPDVTPEVSPPVAVESSTANNGPRLEILPPDENLPIATASAGKLETGATGISTAERDQIARTLRELQEKIDKLDAQNTLLAAQNARFEKDLAAAAANQASLIELDAQQVATSGATSGFWSKFFRYFPWLVIPLLGLALAVQFLNKQKLQRLSLGMVKPYQNSTSGNYNQRIVADLDEYDAVQAEPNTAQSNTSSVIETQQFVDDLTKSQEVYNPTAIVDADVEPKQAYPGYAEDVELDAGQHLDAAQEAEIYLAYQQFKLADKTITRLLEVDPENYKFQILKLHLLAKTGKMEDLQELSVELLSRFPNREDEIHQRIQDICDMAFSANLGAQVDPVRATEADSTAATEVMPEYEETKELDPNATAPSMPTTPLQDDITEFLNEDLTLSDTDPMLVSSIIDHEADTEILDSSEYGEMSDQLTELMDDITEEGLDLPFDLETEIQQEEEKQRLMEEREREQRKAGRDIDSDEPERDQGDENTLLEDDN